MQAYAPTTGRQSLTVCCRTALDEIMVQARSGNLSVALQSLVMRGDGAGAQSRGKRQCWPQGSGFSAGKAERAVCEQHVDAGGFENEYKRHFCRVLVF
jgi:hypothetical protein